MFNEQEGFDPNVYDEDLPDEWSSRAIQHGVNCPKVEHDRRGGYLHSDDDDRPYDVDGVSYCGRCHRVL